MNKRSWLIMLLMFNSAVAEVALRDDGKQVELHADGSWEYLSEGVLATSSSGLRVLLSPDGRWQALAPTSAGAVASASKHIEVSQFNDLVSLKKIQIQKVKQSRGSAKNTVFRHNMLANLVFETLPSRLLLTASSFTLSDNKGVNYPIISVRVGAKNNVYVRAEGAPDRWSRTKALQLTLDKQLLETLSDVSLSVDFRDIKTKIYTNFVDE